ncbi:MAG: VWA domain-containing protein [Gammaproteobacteria bacterium]
MTDQTNDLINNPTPRCACMLVLDVSSSMDGPKIAELNEGARQFLKEVRDDEFALYSVELGVITFGGTVSTVLEFGPLEKVQWEDLPAYGNTPMGQAVNAAIDALEQRKNEYADSGVSYYQPWLVLMTDGMPTDNYHAAATRLRAAAAAKNVVVFGIGIGDECRMDVLAEFCPEKRPPAKLTGLKFKEFFAWLSQSMSRVSQSTPGTKIDLPSTSDWGSIEP